MAPSPKPSAPRHRTSDIGHRTPNERTTARNSRAHPHLRRTDRRRRRQGRRPARHGSTASAISAASCSSTSAIATASRRSSSATRRSTDVAKRLRPEFVVGIIGRVDLRAKEAINPKIKTGEIEVAATRDPPAERREDAAVPDQRGHAGLGRDAAALPLPRPAPPAAAAEHDPAAQDDVRGAAVLRRAELPRDRNADPHQVDAGRGARLPGAEPRASRASSSRCRSRRRSSSRS